MAPPRPEPVPIQHVSVPSSTASSASSTSSVRSDVDPIFFDTAGKELPDTPATSPDEPPVKRGRGRPKGSYGEKRREQNALDAALSQSSSSLIKALQNAASQHSNRKDGPDTSARSLHKFDAAPEPCGAQKSSMARTAKKSKSIDSPEDEASEYELGRANPASPMLQKQRRLAKSLPAAFKVPQSSDNFESPLPAERGLDVEFIKSTAGDPSTDYEEEDTLVDSDADSASAEDEANINVVDVSVDEANQQGPQTRKPRVRRKKGEKTPDLPITPVVPGACLKASDNTACTVTNTTRAGPLPNIQVRSLKANTGTDGGADQPDTGEDAIWRPHFTFWSDRETAKKVMTTQSTNSAITKIIKNAKTRAGPKVGSVYVFESLDFAPRHVKIGKTVEDPPDRQHKLSKCCVPVTLAEIAQRNRFDHHSIVETIVKTELYHVRKTFKGEGCNINHTEWFEMDMSTALQIVDRWRTWVQSERPFNDKWELTPYWQWKVAKADLHLADIKWDEWVRSNVLDRFYHDRLLPVKARFRRKDVQFWAIGLTCAIGQFLLEFLLVDGRWRCAIMILALLLM